ncbi:OprO/OprP family phosphate-selective porin [Ferrimonas balearica]|uniref:OprO/OprP family phosphate-selective porin n=1 Tax=Ferrimonas balearica TaxID=44012 RepID=UPI001C99D08C|nr:OprO/OprP family phosphate-selective porin [Ferrimonas balearica]MBY5923079.1 OprO/OprP family phosphate-selective porin [Ferrimonas balearica]MBY5997545.1 OprO/OprP family phosphate-selective porin [Ferrimonas balearica]
MKNRTTVAVGLALSGVSSLAFAATPGTLTNPNISVVLDGYYQDGERPLGEREEGFGLGHTELALSAAIDDRFYGKLTTVLETQDGETEIGLEEAFIQTLALPGGLSVRAGRFLSDIGYLNNQHLHTDAFVERPAAYRAFLGGHYFDDGVRLNWVAPTDTYWELGGEVFSGDPLQAEELEAPETVGVYHLYTKLGGDIGLSHSWQAGLSWLRNENGQGHLEEHEHVEAAEEPGHDHAHGAQFTGRDLFNLSAVYKWAPNGNYKYNHLTVSGEYFYLDAPFEHGDHGEEEGAPEYYDGWYLSALYQFNPSWSAAVRYGEMNAALFELEGDHGHFHDARIKETEAMVAWHASHFSTVRLQYTHQDVTELGDFDDHVVTLQYIMTLGAHGAHQF